MNNQIDEFESEDEESGLIIKETTHGQKAELQHWVVNLLFRYKWSFLFIIVAIATNIIFLASVWIYQISSAQDELYKKFTLMEKKMVTLREKMSYVHHTETIRLQTVNYSPVAQIYSNVLCGNTGRTNCFSFISRGGMYSEFSPFYGTTLSPYAVPYSFKGQNYQHLSFYYHNRKKGISIVRTAQNELVINNYVLENNYNTNSIPIFDIKSNSLLYLSQSGLKLVECTSRNAVILTQLGVSSYNILGLTKELIVSYFNYQTNSINIVHCPKHNCYVRTEETIPIIKSGAHHVLQVDQFETPIVAFIDNNVLKYWYKNKLKALVPATGDISMIFSFSGEPLILHRENEMYKILICWTIDCSNFKSIPLSYTTKREEFKIWKGSDLFPILTYKETSEVSKRAFTIVEICLNSTCVG